jgi:peptidyl-prolyl cis-trans isomerase A (cyclophilin A)
VRFGLLGARGPAPAPTLFAFAASAEDTLTNPDFARIGHLLARHGFLCASLDIPCHGRDVRKGEQAGSLAGWRARLEKGDGLVPGFTKKVSAVLDYLVKEGYTDPRMVAACGTSRGGFLALHAAAAEPRIRCVAAFAPVTDLLALREFAGMDRPGPAKALALASHADMLAGRAVWLCIGNHDERVGTDLGIAFTRKVVAASVARKKAANVEMHVVATVGHSIHATAHDEAAVWLLAQLRRGERVRVRIETEKGDIEVELDAARAPATAANFLRYVDGGFYDGGRFHRTVRPDNQPGDKVKIGVIQAAVRPGKEKDEFPPVRLERTSRTGLRHRDGTISLARDGPDTATSEFFLCVGDQPELDAGGKRNPDGQGFAAFGRVVRGMAVVRAIQAAAADGQRLTPPVKILRVRRVPGGAEPPPAHGSRHYSPAGSRTSASGGAVRKSPISFRSAAMCAEFWWASSAARFCQRS